MYSASILTAILAVIAQSALGFVIPEGQPDGFYEVRVLENGSQNHVRVRDLPTSIMSPYAARSNTADEQPEDHTSCLPAQGYLDELDTDIVNASLDDWCGSGKSLKNGYHAYAISGCTVGYYCHTHNPYDSEDSTCYADERRRTSQLISDRCGLYRPGFSSRELFPHFGYEEVYGYENHCTIQGRCFCEKMDGNCK